MKQYTELLGLAKSRIDHGFSQVGKRLKAEDPAQRALMMLASRAVAVSNALMILAMNNHANEGLPLLRSLLQLAVEARWIAEKDSAERAREFFDHQKEADWERLWSRGRLLERMKHLGFHKSLEERALMSCYDHLHANAQGLPWGHVFAENAQKGVSGDETLRAASAIMGHVIKALDLHWPGMFPDAEQWWEKTQTA
jgi:hypothetical protein